MQVESFEKKPKNAVSVGIQRSREKKVVGCARGEAVKQGANRSVGKRKRKITGCSTLLQKVEKSADYY